jgi:hypothetical protein
MPAPPVSVTARAVSSTGTMPVQADVVAGVFCVVMGVLLVV